MIRSDWVWYIAEFVMSVDIDGDMPYEYQIHSYIIKAESAEIAYKKSVNLASRLGDSIRNEFGEVVTYKCVGMYNLDVIQDAVLDDEAHISVIDAIDLSGNPPKPRIREKLELSLFAGAKIS